MATPDEPAPSRDGLARRIAPAVVGAMALGLYAATLMPGMAFDDWGEMQSVPHVLGVAHPTGYPTYVLTAWLFELLPIGSVAWRANLLSAVCVAVALAALTAIGGTLGVRPLLAAIAALATGAIATVWGSAVVAEVNPLHLALMALLVHRSLVWADERRLRDLALGGLLVGLGAGNHLLTLFVAPFFVAYALWAGRRALSARPVWLLAPVATALAGLAVYAYIPIAAAAGPPLPYNHPTTLEGIRFLVTGEQFRGQYAGLFTTAGIDPFVGSIGDLWSLAAERATVVFPVLGVAGLVLLVVRRPAFGLACWGALVLGIDVWANYLRLEHYLLVPWLLLGIGVAISLESVAAALTRLAKGRRVPGGLDADRASGFAVGAIGAALAIALVATNLAGANRSGDERAETYVDALLAALPRDAAVLSFWGASTPLWHARFVEGRRPDVLVVDDTNIVYEGWGTRERRIAALVCSRPVYILRPGESDLVPTRAAYDLSPVADLQVGIGTPSAVATVPLYRVEPRAGMCP